MAYNEKLTQRVRELLAHLPDVQEKKMFGSIEQERCSARYYALPGT